MRLTPRTLLGQFIFSTVATLLVTLIIVFVGLRLFIDSRVEDDEKDLILRHVNRVYESSLSIEFRQLAIELGSGGMCISQPAHPPVVFLFRPLNSAIFFY